MAQAPYFLMLGCTYFEFGFTDTNFAVRSDALHQNLILSIHISRKKRRNSLLAFEDKSWIPIQGVAQVRNIPLYVLWRIPG